MTKKSGNSKVYRLPDNCFLPAIPAISDKQPMEVAKPDG
jgi:hypothetical protein